ncbi:MAG: nitronate monooxygenase [Actinomycetales bacterium]|nr:MAG: nitronate monooxygenase [Actinomycetales bacterium]
MTTTDLVRRLGLGLPLVQAPMAGTSTPALAAAVSRAGALGSISIANVGPEAADRMITETAALTDRPVNVNVFCHEPPRADPALEHAWLAHLRPWFEELGATVPEAIHDIYSTFQDDDDQLEILLRHRPAVVSLHLGLPPHERVEALQEAGVVVLASVTDADETDAAVAAGVDVLVAQGHDAGGHRGVFHRDHDSGLGTDDLLRLVLGRTDLPVVAAGGLMDGTDVARVLDAGAAAAQLGTAFVLCPESAADERYRRVLDAATTSRVTSVISGRPARGVPNRFVGEVEPGHPPLPDFGITYDAGKRLVAAAAAAGDDGFGAFWAGSGVARTRSMPAAELVATIAAELAAAR